MSNSFLVVYAYALGRAPQGAIHSAHANRATAQAIVDAEGHGTFAVTECCHSVCPSLRTLESIMQKIDSTNNGKLMICNLTKVERSALPEYLKAEFFTYATFLNHGDAIRVGFKNPL
jgi:hypothetical protein